MEKNIKLTKVEHLKKLPDINIPFKIVKFKRDYEISENKFIENTISWVYEKHISIDYCFLEDNVYFHNFHKELFEISEETYIYDPNYNCLDLKVGDIVKCIGNNYSKYGNHAGSGWEKNLEFEIETIDKYINHNIYFGGKGNNGVYSDCVELVRKRENIEVLEVDQYYKVTDTDGFWMIGKVSIDNNGNNDGSLRGTCHYFIDSNNYFYKNSNWVYKTENSRNYVKLNSNSNEVKWLEACVNANKFITEKEFLKSLENKMETSNKKIYTAEEALEEIKKLGFNIGDKYVYKYIDNRYDEDDICTVEHKPIICGNYIDCGGGFLWHKDCPDHIHRGPIKQFEEIDLSQYKPFPQGYVIPKNTPVIAIQETRSSEHYNYRKPGLKGYVNEDNSTVPFCNWEDGRNKICMCSHHLAPLNPQDHPDYLKPKTNKVMLEGLQVKQMVLKEFYWDNSPGIKDENKNNEIITVKKPKFTKI